MFLLSGFSCSLHKPKHYKEKLKFIVFEFSNSKTPAMAKPSLPQQDSSSSSKRHFHWTKKIGAENDEIFKSSEEEKKENAPKKKLPAVAVARLRSVLSAFGKNRSNPPFGLGPRVVGTLFGYRHGHVHFAFQRDAASPPAFLVELATPISGLVREMASGLVRIALECDKSGKEEDRKKGFKLVEEPVWRTYCNGKKCGYGTRRECGDKDLKILKAVEPISMGAGVLPGFDSDSEIMYMRAKFERIVGSRDSEAFYMMNPDSNGAPELSVYLLRV